MDTNEDGSARHESSYAYETESVDMHRVVTTREERFRQIEIVIWSLFSGTVFLDGFIKTWRDAAQILQTHEFSFASILISQFQSNFPVLILSISIFVFPSLFRTIFGTLPLETIRRRLAKRAFKEADPYTTKTEAEIARQLFTESLSADRLATSSAIQLFSYFAYTSRSLSQSLYSRAGVYLLVGVSVAFSGLAFFYFQTSALGPPDKDENLKVILAVYSPRFGILFFIETIALFFLRQYRSAMDEFRYYEGLKRTREETLALVRMLEESDRQFDPMDLIKNQSLYSKGNILQKDQTTEIIESRKLEKNELELLEKVIEIISHNKK